MVGKHWWQDAAAVVGLSLIGASQSVIHEINGKSGVLLGRAVAGLGDIDGDSIPDFAAGEPASDINGNAAGRARIYSGATGNVIRDFIGFNPGIELGASLDNAGDVDNDGTTDLIIGIPGGGAALAGRFRIRSAATGSILFNVLGGSPGDGLGWAVSGLGDLDGDGHDEFVAAAPFNDFQGDDSGTVFVYSGISGNVMFTFHGDSLDDNLGVSIRRAGDVNNDGVPDLIAGAREDDPTGTGYARVYSGADGSVLHTFTGDSAGDYFGAAVSGAGDVDGDGYDDLVVGAPRNASNAPFSGLVRVFSGSDGAVLHTSFGQMGDRYGIEVSGLGDIDGDGRSDFSGSAQQPNGGAGFVDLYSGRTGMLLASLIGDTDGEEFGYSVEPLGDVDQDGLPDLVVGAPRAPSQFGNNSGYARLYSSRICKSFVFCTTKTNSLGCSPGIAVGGGTSASLSSPSSFDVQAFMVSGQRNGLLFYGLAPLSGLPFLGGTLCVQPPLRRTPVQNAGGTPPPAMDCSGSYSFDFNSHAQSGLDPQLILGQHVFAQWWSRDPSHADGTGVGLTNAVEFTLCD